MSGGETVLVTGGSGYIGGWCVAGLLQQGYVVRTTVRDLAKEAAVRASLAKIVDPGNRLSFHAANLTADAGWDEAAQGCDYVLHVASPLGVADPKDPNDLIVPAREGARRAVGAAVKAGVKRVVLTSSVAATNRGPETRGDWVADETVWTDPEAPRIGAYAQSKTLAERAAWDLIHASSSDTTLATVNPALVLGPVTSDDFSESVQVVERLLSGRVPGIPRLGFNVVDVRDVADLHIRAMTDPHAAGERFIAAGQYAWMGDLATLLRARLGAGAAKVPTRKVPDFVIRLAGLFDKDLGSVTPSLGLKHDYTSEKAQRMLGWKPRPLEDTILDCANSLIANGAV
ncbi:MAG TPA: NAD-dependent epimerase/dehydratase family protein [Phenylobacterium sp.]|jgi:nucleoside-diphosphate-sugar epimerase|uniref:NAD-dependent epimerase/dehydratase family protein n=1 Tax=Phenylobacterium sp. TaxID=1871053 RepID=UPI002D2789F2|nr:NAD-dependent epimerase/dehydratase family protein [Phenylobacterium sp.]HZZ70424.1 NAD-dependent epimerase/dehydratase family protein [Phenylobacterium sp.]